jgi:hypothetical protein
MRCLSTSPRSAAGPMRLGLGSYFGFYGAMGWQKL